MQNYQQTILAQYANSPIITGLIADFNTWIDPTADIDNFYETVWNIQTASGFGLDILGRIVNIGRNVSIPGTNVDFGFKEALPGSYGFGQAPFFTGKQATTTFALSDPAYRTLILAKAFINIANYTAPSINALLQILFAGRGTSLVLDNGGMSITYVFEFPLLVWELAILQSDFLPRPAGVLATIHVVPISETFGFMEGNFPPFGVGNFYY